MGINSQQELEKHNRLNGLSGRIVIWRNVFEIIKENPLLGVGPSNTQSKLNEKYSTDPLGKEALNNSFNAHNQYLQSYLELGLIGFLIIVSIYFNVFLTAFKSKNIFYISISILVITSSMTESLFQVYKGLVFFILAFILIQSFKANSKII